MSAIADYLKQRAAEPLDLNDNLVAALDHLATAGAAIDRTLTRAERVKALATRDDVGRFEQTAQTLAALSREVWIAHGATLTTINALKQLADVERDLPAE
jgi:hypothetical protein